MAHLRRTHYASFHLALGLWIFDGNYSSLGETLRKNQHRAAGADRMGMAFKGTRFASDLHHNANPKQDALGAAALFGRGRTRRYNPGGGVGRFEIRLRFHSSSPQKSISGATSSTPYSQPSGRGTPRQTTTAALLVSVARFVSARRCSSCNSCSRTTMQPYGLTTRVWASTEKRLPVSPSHSSRTGTREFMRRPRRLSPWRPPNTLDSRVFTDIFASGSHARVEVKNGQWYGRVEAHERIAVRKDRLARQDGQSLRNLIEI